MRDDTLGQELLRLAPRCAQHMHLIRPAGADPGVAVQARKEQLAAREPDANGIVSAQPPLSSRASSTHSLRAHPSSGSLLGSPSQRGSALGSAGSQRGSAGTLARAAQSQPSEAPSPGSKLAQHPVGSAAELSGAAGKTTDSRPAPASDGATQVNGHVDVARDSPVAESA